MRVSHVGAIVLKSSAAVEKYEGKVHINVLNTN